MTNQDVTIKYYLPKSVIRISGAHARSWVIDWGDRGIVEVVDDAAIVSIETVADTGPKGAEDVTFTAGKTEEAAYTCNLYPDGRLKAFAGRQDSRLDEVVGAAAKVLSVVGGAALAVANPAMGAFTLGTAIAGRVLSDSATVLVDDGSTDTVKQFEQASQREPTPEERRYSNWAEAFPHRAERGQALYQTLKALESALLKAAPNTVTGKDLGEAWLESAKVREELNEELLALEEAARTWLATKEPALANSTFLAELEDLYQLQLHQTLNLPDMVTPTPNDLKRPWVERLQVLVAIRLEDAGIRDPDQTPESNSDEVWVRLPRPATIGIYVPNGPANPWILRQIEEVPVVNGKSRTIRLPVNPRRHGDASILVEISETGLPATIGMARASEAANIAKAASTGLGGFADGVSQVQAGLADAVALRASVATLRASRVENQIADLERRTRLAAAEAAVASEVSTRPAMARKQRLEAELASLQALVGIREAKAKLGQE
jgi:hypothetical protein